MSGKKIIPINQNELRKNSRKYDFKETVGKFEQYAQNPEEQHKVFTELGFEWHDDEEICLTCDRNGSCPDHPREAGLYVDGRLNLQFGSPLKKIPVYVDAMEVASAMEDQNNEIESSYFLDLETGNVELVTSDTHSLAESDDPKELDEMPEWQKEEVERAKKTIQGFDEGRFVRISRMEPRESFRHMEEFVESLRVGKLACRVLFDNHHGKGDHMHVDGVQKSYAFESFAKLKEDFENEVRKLGGQI